MAQSKGAVATKVAAGLIAAAAAGYYFYGSKRAKKNRAVVAKELKVDWQMIQNELQKISRESIARGKKAVKKVAKARTSR